jgi:alpha-methylacyl-CoA racemase
MEDAADTHRGRGPLRGLRVLELASIGPGPFAAMLLADLGADVVRVDRIIRGPSALPGAPPVLGRGRRSVAVDLKRPEGQALILDLVCTTDILVEGFRPGVAERLGVGPSEAMSRHPRLIYARITGWGQTGPLAAAAGHDINYIALTGALAAMGAPGRPPDPPLNLVGDFGGGGMLAVVGILAALFERGVSGRGQVIDAAMIDGTSLLSTMFFELLASGAWVPERGANLLDGGAPFYATYETADGRFVAVGALEPQFFSELIATLGFDVDCSRQHDRATWPDLRRRLAEAFRQRTRDEWAAVFNDTDACVAPVLTFGEVHDHTHHRARGSYLSIDGVLQPAPAPRFDRTPTAPRLGTSQPGEHTIDLLMESGIDEERVRRLLEIGVVQQREPLTAPS